MSQKYEEMIKSSRIYIVAMQISLHVFTSTSITIYQSILWVRFSQDYNEKKTEARMTPILLWSVSVLILLLRCSTDISHKNSLHLV